MRGVVRDAATKKPLAGATVAPIIDMHQARGPFRERRRENGCGRAICGARRNPDWGAVVEHQVYKCITSLERSTRPQPTTPG